MKKILVLVAIVFLLSFYVWERSIAFKLLAEVSTLTTQANVVREGLARSQAEVARLASYTRLEARFGIPANR